MEIIPRLLIDHPCRFSCQWPTKYIKLYQTTTSVWKCCSMMQHDPRSCILWWVVLLLQGATSLNPPNLKSYNMTHPNPVHAPYLCLHMVTVNHTVYMFQENIQISVTVIHCLCISIQKRTSRRRTHLPHHGQPLPSKVLSKREKSKT